MLTGKPFELVCPAGALPALKAAVDNGADCVYTGLKDNTNARNFTGLNFDLNNAKEGVRYAHAKGRKVLLIKASEKLIGFRLKDYQMKNLLINLEKEFCLKMD